VTAPDVRTAAQTEAERLTAEHPESPSQDLEDAAFVAGAVWGAAYVTPTREQIAEALTAGYDSVYSSRMPVNEHDLRAADSVLALMQGLAEGEHDGLGRTTGV